MAGEILQFDGLSFPVGPDCEPAVLGLMRGTPPAAGQQVRFADGRFLQYPQNRWALSHLRELVPTVAVWRGSAGAVALPESLAAGQSLDQMCFEDLEGRGHTWLESLARTYTDGILILHRGALVYERY